MEHSISTRVSDAEILSRYYKGSSIEGIAKYIRHVNGYGSMKMARNAVTRVIYDNEMKLKRAKA